MGKNKHQNFGNVIKIPYWKTKTNRNTKKNRHHIKVKILKKIAEILTEVASFGLQQNTPENSDIDNNSISNTTTTISNKNNNEKKTSFPWRSSVG